MNYEISRFMKAHQSDYQRALSEIKNGKKVSHWMWYIFPQMKGIGHSSMSEYYGIRDLDEARAYLADPVLGKHLTEICEALLSFDTDDAATESLDVFQMVLDKYYHGKKDCRTLKMLGIK